MTRSYPKISVVTVAWGNNDMKPTMNLVGQDYVSFCATSSVGIKDKTARLSPESEWMDLKDLSVKMITDGLPRDDNSVFMGSRQLLHQSPYPSSDAGVGALNHTSQEVEVRRMSPVILSSYIPRGHSWQPQQNEWHIVKRWRSRPAPCFRL